MDTARCGLHGNVIPDAGPYRYRSGRAIAQRVAVVETKRNPEFCAAIKVGIRNLHEWFPESFYLDAAGWAPRLLPENVRRFPFRARWCEVPHIPYFLVPYLYAFE